MINLVSASPTELLALQLQTPGTDISGDRVRAPSYGTWAELIGTPAAWGTNRTSYCHGTELKVNKIAITCVL